MFLWHLQHLVNEGAEFVVRDEGFVVVSAQGHSFGFLGVDVEERRPAHIEFVSNAA